MNFKEFCFVKGNNPYENIFPKGTLAPEAVNILKDYLLGDDHDESGKEYPLFPEGLSAQETVDQLAYRLLGKDWYCLNPVSAVQCNTEIVAEIMAKIPSKKYRDYPFWKKILIHMECWVFGRRVYDYY